eukprot:gene6430-12997_t
MDRNVTDQGYLEMIDLDMFMKTLLEQIFIHKPDNPLDFSKKYFQRVQSCQHVLGGDFEFVLQCRHNRRAFIYCCTESFQNFSLYEELGISDYHQLLQMICPDFPLLLLQEASCIINPVETDLTGRYIYGDLRLTVFFHLMYKEWISELKKLFTNDTSSGSVDSLIISIPASRLQYRMNTLYADIPTAINRPPNIAIDHTVSALYIGSKPVDVNYNKFMQTLIFTQSLQDDLYYKPLKAQSFVSLLSPRFSGVTNTAWYKLVSIFPFTFHRAAGIPIFSGPMLRERCTVVKTPNDVKKRKCRLAHVSEA